MQPHTGGGELFPGVRWGPASLPQLPPRGLSDPRVGVRNDLRTTL